MKICLAVPNTLRFPEGGHLWVFLNWALGFKALGHKVFWLDLVDAGAPVDHLKAMVGGLRARLLPFGLGDAIALSTREGNAIPHERDLGCRPLEEACSADFLCDHRYDLPQKIVARIRKSMLIDIDPGLLHESITQKFYDIAPHSSYYTIGEYVLQSTPPKFNTHGYAWQYTPPPVALDQWPVKPVNSKSAFTTVSNWWMDQWMPDGAGGHYKNDKREAFQPYLDLPKHSPQPMELCLNLGGEVNETNLLREKGWQVREAGEVGNPQVYRRYIQDSFGEFSCAKPGYVKLETGWLSDRTICYLASGRPVVVQRTGSSAFLPDDCGIFRFTDFDSARHAIKMVCSDYANQSRAARRLAEDHFDAKKVLKRILERCI